MIKKQCDSQKIDSCFYVTFYSEEKSQLDTYRVKGFLLNTNTIDQFKMCDKSHLLRNAGAKVCVCLFIHAISYLIMSCFTESHHYILSHITSP